MSELHISLKPEEIFTIGNFPVTNSLFIAVCVSLILIVVLVGTGLRMKEVPGKFQLLIEELVGGLHNFVHSITQSKKLTTAIFPLFATLALFFMLSNLLGLIPGLAAISISGTPAFRAPTTDYSLIFVITMVMFIVWQLVAVFTAGFVGYFKQYFNFSSPLNFALGILDIIGEAAKIVSLSFRLFGNIFAGEVIATVMLTLAPFVAPVPFALLGLLSSVIQALVFPILVLIFIKMSVAVKEEQASGTQ